jgi:hypothetical protein
VACPCFRQDTGGPGGGWEGLSSSPSRPFRSDLPYRRYGPATLAACPEAGDGQRVNCRWAYEGLIARHQGWFGDSKQCSLFRQAIGRS